MSAGFDKKILTNRSELLNYKNDILNLFDRCFEQKIDEELWDWAYVQNPNGDPIVSLHFDGKKLIGHYAVIPLIFLSGNKKIKAALSMTTMVDSDYRGRGIFVEQAEEVYNVAKALGYKFVCGFPNENSAPGFVKYLGWTLDYDLFLAKLTYDELQLQKQLESSSHIVFGIEDHANLNWRLSKPGQVYFWSGENILKKFGDEFDVVFVGESFSELTQGEVYNLLLKNKADINSKVSDYIFGYRFFDDSLKDKNIKADLLISDVF